MTLVTFRKKATNYRAPLRKMTYKDALMGRLRHSVTFALIWMV